MSEKIAQLNEGVIKGQLKELVHGSVEETLNGLPETVEQKLTQAARYERCESSVEEARSEMYLACVSVWRVEESAEALWGSKASPATITLSQMGMNIKTSTF